jgi:transcriptional regulator with XRE-family HTH domain
MPDMSVSESTIMPAKRARSIDAFPAELGANIRRFREERRLTQRDLCRAAQYDLAQLSAVERGLAVPRADALRRIADVLDVSLDRLCGRRTFKAAGAETESRSGRTADQLLSAGTMAIVEELDDLRRRVERLEAISGSRVRLRSKT